MVVIVLVVGILLAISFRVNHHVRLMHGVYEAGADALNVSENCLCEHLEIFVV